MASLIGLVLLSFGLGYVLTPCVRTLACRVGLVDRPDGRRKKHDGCIPVSGGVAVFLAATLAMVVVAALSQQLSANIRQDASFYVGLLLASAVITTVGVADDFNSLRGRYKLLGQFLAVGIVVYSGLIIERVSILGFQVELGILAVPFTVFWLLGAINSLNLIDGMDGLLCCVGFIISFGMAIMALLQENVGAAHLALALSGATLAFLRYNFPPASIFLGDAGSMLIGLVIGVLAIRCSLKGPATVALAAPIAILAIPIIDTGAAILRRKLTGRSIYTTDRGHLHHCLLRRGFSNRLVLLLISVFSVITVLGALVSQMFNSETIAIITMLVVIGIMIATRLFGYAEFLLVRDRLLAAMSSLVPVRPATKVVQSEVHLQGSADWKGFWDHVTASATSLNLRAVYLDVNAPAFHENYHARWDRPELDADEQEVWRVEIPLSLSGHSIGVLKATGLYDQESAAARIAVLANMVSSFERFVSLETTALTESVPVEAKASPEAPVPKEDRQPALFG